jgi:hypothetical protein
VNKERMEISDGSSWPNPKFNIDKELGWKLRHSKLTDYENMVAAGIVDAYNELITRGSGVDALKMVRRRLKEQSNEQS